VCNKFLFRCMHVDDTSIMYNHVHLPVLLFIGSASLFDYKGINCSGHWKVRLSRTP
jgi:hypothetical protein